MNVFWTSVGVRDWDSGSIRVAMVVVMSGRMGVFGGRYPSYRCGTVSYISMLWYVASAPSDIFLIFENGRKKIFELV
jgi:hypothetical protein